LAPPCGSGEGPPAGGGKKIYRFAIGNIPAIAAVSDAGWDELVFKVAF
jgi:hypothetical protein